jgi:hypothetical protein
MYAAYELLERLGIVFQITNDIIPEQKPDLALPALDVRMEPMAKFRGLMKEEAEGNWYMGLKEWHSLIDQMAKLKSNTLMLWIGIGSPWLKFSYNGKVGEILNSPESGYLAYSRDRSWGSGLSPHITTATARDVRVGREVFPQEYVGAPEFAAVRTPDEAFDTAREFLRELIRYAHQRHVYVSLTLAELSFVPENLADVRKPGMIHRFCGVALSPSDPVTLDIWETAMGTLIETYPEADSYGFWTAEHSPDMRDPRTQEILHRYAAVRAKLPSIEEIRRRGNVQETNEAVSEESLLDSDFLQMYLCEQLIQRVKKHYPSKQLVVMTLFRGYMLPVLDTMLPKDVWLGNMEECSTTRSTMSFYSGMGGRDLIVVPRVSDDGDEFHMQLNAGEFDQDEMISGAAMYGLAGVVGYSAHLRHETYSASYLAEGAWDPQIRPRSFYESYLSRLYGQGALDPLLKAFLLLEENEEHMVYWGRSEIFRAFEDWSPVEQLRTNVDYRAATPTVRVKGVERVDAAADVQAVERTAKLDREELMRAINATWGMGPFWKYRLAIASPHAADLAMTEGQFYESRAGQCRQALKSLRQARAKVLPGSRAELEYVIYKTETLISYFEVLRASYDARVTLDRAWLAMVDGNWVEFGTQLHQTQAVLDMADRQARAIAGQMIAYSDDPGEKYLLVRYNRNVIGGIERGQSYVADVIKFHDEKSR